MARPLLTRQSSELSEIWVFRSGVIQDSSVQAYKAGLLENRYPGLGGGFLLCSVDGASRYICVIKTNLMHYLASVYFVSQPLHVSGIFAAHHQEVYSIYTTIDNKYPLLYICSILPDDGLQICPKHIEVDWRNKLRINSASSWFLL
jgi:NADH:ubiquinone oxidoreductase subunit F (NADH-binding)